MPSVLIAEDETEVRHSLEEGLSAAGFQVTTVGAGDDAINLALTQPFDFVILDWMLPRVDGLQVLTTLRQAGRTVPILLLTARDVIEDRVLGLDSGADDYLVKPFAFAELLARMRVLLRRGNQETALRAGELELDLLKRQTVRLGEVIELTAREFEVLEYLVRHKNEPVTREMLGLEVFKDPGYAYTNVIEVYINLLRKKIELANRSPRIVTLRGVGYRLTE